MKMKCPHCGEEISETNFMPVIISTGEEFEQFLCDRVNEQEGLFCERTKITGDQGVDLVVRVGGRKVAVQCKLYSDPVGNAAVQEVVAGRIMYKCDLACVVTNSSYTNSAMKLADATEVELLHYANFVKYLVGLRDGSTGEAAGGGVDELATAGDWNAVIGLIVRSVANYDLKGSDEDGIKTADLFNAAIRLASIAVDHPSVKIGEEFNTVLVKAALKMVGVFKMDELLEQERWLRIAAYFCRASSGEWERYAKSLLQKADAVYHGRCKASGTPPVEIPPDPAPYFGMVDCLGRHLAKDLDHHIHLYDAYREAPEKHADYRDLL